MSLPLPLSIISTSWLVPRSKSRAIRRSHQGSCYSDPLKASTHGRIFIKRLPRGGSPYFSLAALRLAQNKYNVDLDSLNIIFLNENNCPRPPTQWKDAVWLWNEIHRLQGRALRHLSRAFNSAWECVCFEVTKSDKRCWVWANGSFELVWRLSPFLPVETPTLWILPRDMRAISTHWFQHREVVCLIWVKWLKLSRDE